MLPPAVVMIPFCDRAVDQVPRTGAVVQGNRAASVIKRSSHVHRSAAAAEVTGRRRRKDARAGRCEAAAEVECRCGDIQAAGVRPAPSQIDGCPGSRLNRARTAPGTAVERERAAGHIGADRPLVDEVAAAIGANRAGLAVNGHSSADRQGAGTAANYHGVVG